MIHMCKKYANISVVHKFKYTPLPPNVPNKNFENDVSCPTFV